MTVAELTSDLKRQAVTIHAKYEGYLQNKSSANYAELHHLFSSEDNYQGTLFKIAKQYNSDKNINDLKANLLKMGRRSIEVEEEPMLQTPPQPPPMLLHHQTSEIKNDLFNEFEEVEEVDDQMESV